MDKDKSIVIQVAAKIAAELTPRKDNMDSVLGDFAVLFDGIKGILVDEIFGQVPMSREDKAMEMITNAFDARPVTSEDVASIIRIKGKQHGELPGWLISACAEAGISEVYDNRDGLSENPKRPWFKATTGTKAFWPPKGK
jgi:hypothetical protein